MANKKGALRNSDGVVDAADYIPRLAMPGARDVIDVKEESWGRIAFGWLKGLLAFGVILLLLVGLLYSGLSATLMMLSSVNSDSNSREWVVRNTWGETGGKPPLDQKVVISTTKALPAEWWNRILVGWTGIAAPAVVRIASTDYEKLYIANSEVTNLTTEESGEFTSSAAFQYNTDEELTEQNYKLDNEYLVECVSGSCEAGTYFVIDAVQIFGERQIAK